MIQGSSILITYTWQGTGIAGSSVEAIGIVDCNAEGTAIWGCNAGEISTWAGVVAIGIVGCPEASWKEEVHKVGNADKFDLKG
jgi:hypothetical protein